jgi:hypothetical protein
MQRIAILSVRSNTISKISKIKKRKNIYIYTHFIYSFQSEKYYPPKMKFTSTLFLFSLFVLTSVKARSQISPVWQTYFGGSGSEVVHASLRCANGDYLIAATSSSPSGFPASNAVNSTFSGMFDGLLVRFTSSGEMVWWTFYGSNQADLISHIQEDGEGNIWVAGTTRGNIPTSPNAFTVSLPFGSGTNVFIAQFSSSGEWLSATLLGGDGDEGVSSFKLLPNGKINVVGQTSSPNLATSGALDGELNGDVGLFIAIIDGVTDLQELSYVEGSDGFLGSNFGAGNQSYFTSDGTIIFIEPTSATTGVATSDALFPEPIATFNSIVGEMTTAGEIIWATYYPRDAFNGCAHLGNGYFSIFGRVANDNNLATPGAYQEEIDGSGDGFISLWRETGELVWATYIGNDDTDLITEEINTVTYTEGKIFFSGTVSTASTLSTPDAWQTEPLSANTMKSSIFGWFNEEGELEYCSYLPQNTGVSNTSSMFIDASTLVIPMNSTTYDEWVLSPELNQNHSGGFDICVVKFDLESHIDEKNTPLSLTLFPNPTSDFLFLSGINLAHAKMQIVDTSGKVCLEAFGIEPIQVNQLTKGTYVLHVQTKDGMAFGKPFLKL